MQFGWQWCKWSHVWTEYLSQSATLPVTQRIWLIQADFLLKHFQTFQSFRCLRVFLQVLIQHLIWGNLPRYVCVWICDSHYQQTWCVYFEGRCVCHTFDCLFYITGITLGLYPPWCMRFQTFFSQQSFSDILYLSAFQERFVATSPIRYTDKCFYNRPMCFKTVERPTASTHTDAQKVHAHSFLNQPGGELISNPFFLFVF